MSRLRDYIFAKIFERSIYQNLRIPLGVVLPLCSGTSTQPTRVSTSNTANYSGLVESAHFALFRRNMKLNLQISHFRAFTFLSIIFFSFIDSRGLEVVRTMSSI